MRVALREKYIGALTFESVWQAAALARALAGKTFDILKMQCLISCQMRPNIMSKETYYHAIRHSDNAVSYYMYSIDMHQYIYLALCRYTSIHLSIRARVVPDL